MKKLTNNLLIYCFLTLIFSCSKKSDLEQVFITKQNEYWEYKDNCHSYGIYFKFNKNGDYDKYLSKPISEGKGFDLFNNDGDLISSKRTWSIKSDSIFSWDGEDYTIESINSEKITLFYLSERKEECRIVFTKVIDK